MEKRRLAGNFYQDLLYSYPARNSLRPEQCTMRQIVACAVCAFKDWIDDFYPCFAWKDAPSVVLADAAEHEDDDDETDGERDEQHLPGQHGRYSGPQLRDEDDFCYLAQPTKSMHGSMWTHTGTSFQRHPLTSYMHQVCNTLDSQLCNGS